MGELKDYLNLWAGGLPERESIQLTTPINVTGTRNKALGPRGEFAKVQLTLYPAPSFEVVDDSVERAELERLGVGWPDSFIFGLLDILMFAEPGPLYKVCTVLEAAWYHEVDSSFRAFRCAGQDAGRKVVEHLVGSRGWKTGP